MLSITILLFLHLFFFDFFKISAVLPVIFQRLISPQRLFSRSLLIWALPILIDAHASLYLVPDPLYCWSSCFFSIAVLSFLPVVISFTLSLFFFPLFPLLSSSSLFPSSFSAHQTSPPFFLDIWLHFQAATRPATRGEAGMKTGRRARLRFHRPERE